MRRPVANEIKGDVMTINITTGPAVHLPSSFDWVNGVSGEHYASYALGGLEPRFKLAAEITPSGFRAFEHPAGRLLAVVGQDSAFVLQGEKVLGSDGKRNFLGALRLAQWRQMGPETSPSTGIFVASTLEVRGNVTTGLGFAVAEVNGDTFRMGLGLEGVYPMQAWLESPHLLGAALASLQTEGYQEVNAASVSDGSDLYIDIRNARTIKIPRPGLHPADTVKIIPGYLNGPARVFLKKGITGEYVELRPGSDFMEYFDGDGGCGLGSNCIKINPWREGQNPVILGQFYRGFNGYHLRAPIWPNTDYYHIGDRYWVAHLKSVGVMS